jgi:hypothetical protein
MAQPLELAIQTVFHRTLELLRLLESPEPIFFTVTLLGAKGLPMGSTGHAFDRDVIICPDVPIQDLSDGYPYPSMLLPIVDSIWQAVGAAKTENPRLWQPRQPPVY